MFTGCYLGIGRAVWVADPEAVNEILNGDSEVFHAGPNGVLEFLVGRNSIFTLDGDRHRRKRRLLLPPFHSESVKRYAELFREITEREVSSWPADQPFAVRPRIQAIALESIMRAVFGIEQEGRLAMLRELIPPLLDLVGTLIWIAPLHRDFGAWSPWTRLLRYRAAVEAILRDEIACRRSDARLAQRTDVLSLLLQARDEDGNALSDEELRDETTTLLFAGHETTATAIAWALDLLLHDPTTLERLSSDLAAGTDAYLEAVIKETLRVRPIVLDVVRFPQQAVEIRGFEIPAGTRILPAIAPIQRRPDLYPEPERFRPERFLEKSPAPQTWIPFGGGVRRCIGAAFAMLEMRVVLRTILERVRLRPVSAALDQPRWRIVTMAPARGVRVVVEARLSSPDERAAYAT